jgi:RecB family exonuclease
MTLHVDDAAPPATGAVRVVPFGAEAFAALWDALADIRGGDPLARADVAVPSSFVGVTVRRRLATPGLVGVRFTSLPRIIADRAAATLAGAGREVLGSAQRRAATRAVLASARGPLSDAAARSSATIGVVAGLFAELDDAELGGSDLDELAHAGGWAAQIGELYGRYAARTAKAARPKDVVDAACASDDATPLIVYLPRRLGPGELRFCRSLAERGLLRVVVGLTGEADADKDAEAILAALGGTTDGVNVPTPGAETRALPDAEEEARYAVRRILDHIERHPGTPVDRLAVAYRAATPYARLISEQLTAAGLPHHAPRQRTLAQTVPGRTLLGLLDLPAAQFSRVAVLDWIRDCPVRDGKERLPVSRWQRQANEAGVTRGLAQWTPKLERYAGDLRDADEERRAKHVQQAHALAAFVEAVASRLDAISTAGTWAAAAALLREALDHHLGGPQQAATWGWHKDSLVDPEVQARCDVERAAYEQVNGAIDALGSLDEVEVVYDFDGLHDVVAQELDRHVTEATGLGRGVLVGPVWDVAGADLDLLVIVGATEGVYPPRGREHPLLRDGVRAHIRLRTLDDRRRSERRDHLAALASAPTVVLTHPVADVRSQRGAEPAPWLLEQTRTPEGERQRSREEKRTAPESFAASVLDPSLPAGTESEHDVRAVLGGADTDAVAGINPTLARGLDAARARLDGVFGPWTGGLTRPLADDVRARLEEKLSATALERYATCGFQFLLRHVLGIHVVDEPDESKADSRERGTAVHDVLERLVATSLGRAPDEPWSEADHRLAQDLLTERLDLMKAEGKAGRPQVWDAEVQLLRRKLRRMLIADDALRQAMRMRPVAVEHTFGYARDDAPARDPLVLELESGEVRLGGSIDRVDVVEGGGLVVQDYKTGKSEKYDAFPKDGVRNGKTDFVARGTKLQLPLYALAAMRDFPQESGEVTAFYTFVDENAARRGGTLTDEDFDRFLDVADTVASGIRDGAFPLHPGAYDGFFRSFASCSWCDFQRVCPIARDDLWEGLREDSRVKRYADVVEPQEDDQ